MITAYAETTVKDQALSLGANAFITKPFDINELVSTVKVLLKANRKELKQ